MARPGSGGLAGAMGWKRPAGAAVGGVLERREQGAETDGDEPALVHFRGVPADAEAGEDEEPERDADPAVEDHRALGGNFDHLIPALPVHTCPIVRLEREGDVLVEDVELHREDDNEQNTRKDQQAEEAGLVETGGSSAKDMRKVAAVDAEAVQDDDGVVAVEEAEEGRPDVEEGDGRPGVVDGRRAARDGKDVVPARLDHVMHARHPHRRRKTQRTIHQVPPLTLLRRQRHSRLVRIQRASEMAHDAGNASDEPEAGCEFELYFDVAEAGAAEPDGEVVGGPEEGVDDVEEEGEEDPGDESDGGEGAGFAMPD